FGGGFPVPDGVRVLAPAAVLAVGAVPRTGRDGHHPRRQLRQRAPAAGGPLRREREERIEEAARGHVLSGDVPDPGHRAGEEERGRERDRVTFARSAREPRDRRGDVRVVSANAPHGLELAGPAEVLRDGGREVEKESGVRVAYRAVLRGRGE